MSKVLLVDNYDSVTDNLAHYLSELGADVAVRRPEQLSSCFPLHRGEPAVQRKGEPLGSPEPPSPSRVGQTSIDGERTRAVARQNGRWHTHLVLSPGPGRPSEQLIGLVRDSRVPTLGVCLGHQAIVQAFGGEIASAQRLLHGKTSLIEHDGRGVFAGLPQALEVGRYHSLAATTVPAELEISARSDDGEIMGVRHRTLPIEGVQFHPESVLTPLGMDLLRNFLR
ncbi:MAG: anthranilate synthase component II [Gaiellaceae bacterium]